MSNTAQIPDSEWEAMAALVSGRLMPGLPSVPAIAAAPTTLTDEDWAAMFGPTTTRTAVPTAQAAPVPATPAAPSLVVQAPTTSATEDHQPPKPRLRTADEIVAAQALKPANSADEMREIEAFLTAPDPIPAPQRVKIPSRGTSRTPTRDAMDRLADRVYELHVLLVEMHKRICTPDVPLPRPEPPGPLDGHER
jgi:hypothetical protein